MSLNETPAPQQRGQRQPVYKDFPRIGGGTPPPEKEMQPPRINDRRSAPSKHRLASAGRVDVADTAIRALLEMAEQQLKAEESLNDRYVYERAERE